MDFAVSKEIKLGDQIFDVRYHPDQSKNLAVAVTIGGDVFLMENKQRKFKIAKHHKGSSIRKVRFDNEGRMLTIAKTVKIYDLNSNQTVHTLKRDGDKKTSFYSVRPLGDHLVAGGDDDGGIFVWDKRTATDKSIFSSQDCQQYISDIDGKADPRRLLVCTSGEGTLTAYDLRANKMIEPQSELFETGFQCVKMIESNRKVVIGGEDGAVYVFNYNEWAHTSGKFAISDDAGNKGRCSIDGIDVLPDSSTFIAACSDGRLRSFTLWPHEIVSEKVFCRKAPLESVHSNHDGSELVVSGDNYINFIDVVARSDEEHEEDDSSKSSTDSDSQAKGDSDDKHEKTDDGAHKKFKADNDDYLNVFT